MARQTWLADALRAAGVKVVEVSGWKTRGSTSFSPIGITWHATAGSRSATAQGEVNVILNGSATAPPPIAQMMIWRDGTVYICASGRCNHNKVGWAGPNKGLGNTALFGIEMANDNKGEPWPAAQLDAARKATAAIMTKIGADPRKRMAGHYEHQPAAGKPPGETSTKTDPKGVNMSAERSRVYALMTGGEDEVGKITDPAQAQQLRDAHYVTAVAIPSPTESGKRVPLHVYLGWLTGAVKALATAVGQTDEEVKKTLKTDFDTLNAKVAEAELDSKEAVKGLLSGLGETPVAETAEILRGVYDAEELAALKAAL